MPDIFVHTHLYHRPSFLPKADAEQQKSLSSLIKDAQSLRDRLPPLDALSELLNTKATELPELQEKTKSLHDAMTAVKDAGWTSKDCLEIGMALGQIAEMAKQIEVIEVRF